MASSVSVVIPTIGRPDLSRAIDSALKQTLAPEEVIVVNDGHEPLRLGDHAGTASVITVNTGGGRGAAEARNMGVAASRTDFIALLDDDDIWLPHHLASVRACFEANPDIDIYSSAALALYPHRHRIEPTVLFQGPRSLLDFFYGDTVWARRHRRIPTSTIACRRQVFSSAVFDSDLESNEDTWWLLVAEQSGHCLVQEASVDAVCRYDPARETSRLTVPVILAWAERLDGLRAGAGANYLVGHVCRTLARNGQIEEFARVADAVRRRPTLSRQAQLVLLMERALANLRGARSGAR